MVSTAKITATEGNDIKKVLIEKGIGGGIDEAIKLVDKLASKYLGLSDDEEKSKAGAGNVTVNVYCGSGEKAKVIRTTNPPIKPPAKTCEGVVKDK